MYFIDPSLEKNKNYYIQELEKMGSLYSTPLHLFYGEQFFKFIGHPRAWERLLSWLSKWKNDLPEFPEINHDISPEESFHEIKTIETRYWRRFFTNDKLWEDGIIRVLFSDGTTLRMLADHFSQQDSPIYENLAKILEDKLRKYYE